MTDIVERLRKLAAIDNCQASIEAANEIERLRAEMAGDKILEDCEMHDPVWAAIAGVWGKRCEDFEEGCPCCRAWAEYDKITRLKAIGLRPISVLVDAINAWPKGYSLSENDSASIRNVLCIILPLPQEVGDE